MAIRPTVPQLSYMRARACVREGMWARRLPLARVHPYMGFIWDMWDGFIKCRAIK